MLLGEVRRFREDTLARTHHSTVCGKYFMIISRPDSNSFVDIMIDGEISHDWPVDFIAEESEVIDEAR